MSDLRSDPRLGRFTENARPIERDRAVVRRTQGQQPQVEAQNSKGNNKLFAACLGVIAAVVLVALGVIGTTLLGGDNNVQSKTVTTTVTSAPSVTQMASASECPDSLPVFHDPHVDMNAVSAGLRPGFGGPDTLKNIETQPEYVAYALNGFFPNEFKDPPDWKQFVTNDGKCFSTKGLLMQERLKGALTSKDTRVEENVSIPTNLVNTGIGRAGPVTNGQPGIPSGRKGVKYTFANGQETYVDYHCANIPKKGVPQTGFTITQITSTVVESSTPVIITTEQPPCLDQECFPTIITTPPPVCVPPQPECTPTTIITTPPTTITTTTPPNKTCESEYGQGWTGHYPICKEPYTKGPETTIPALVPRGQLPADPTQAEPSTPWQAPPGPTYTAPATTVTTVAPTITQSQTPRTTVSQAPEAPVTSTTKQRDDSGL